MVREDHSRDAIYVHGMISRLSLVAFEGRDSVQNRSVPVSANSLVCTYMCIYVYISICMCVCIYIYIHLYMYIYCWQSKASNSISRNDPFKPRCLQKQSSRASNSLRSSNRSPQTATMITKQISRASNSFRVSSRFLQNVQIAFSQI